MKKKIISVVCSLLSVVSLNAQNPIVSHCYTADPAPMVFEGNDSLYVYCDEDMNVPSVNDFYYMERWRVYSTVDMVNWTDHGEAMPRTAFKWGDEGTCWASQCVKKGDYYYWYMCLSKPNDWRHYIGLGRSKKPSGPFKDVLKKPLFDTGEGGDIDPTVFIDDDGQAYLYWGNNKLRYAKLSSVMISINTNIGKNGIVEVPLTKEAFGGVKVDDQVTGKDCYEEGPWLDKRGDNYYLMYAAGGVPEHISYSMSKSPEGPWEYKGIVMKQQDTGSFTNHSGMVHYQGKDYFFYHTGWAPKGGGGFNRSMAVEEMHFNDDGTIKPITATHKGVKALRTMSPYIPVTGIHAGDSMRVANLDFGTEGAKSITLRVASANGKGTLVIRQDHAKGKLLARIPIAATGGDNVWAEQTFDLTTVPTGTHAIHFSFTGTDTSTLFNWDWWQFNEFTSEIEAIPLSPDKRKNAQRMGWFYTLQGVPVTTPTKGIYIKDGKRVFIP